MKQIEFTKELLKHHYEGMQNIDINDKSIQIALIHSIVRKLYDSGSIDITKSEYNIDNNDMIKFTGSLRYMTENEYNELLIYLDTYRILLPPEIVGGFDLLVSKIKSE